MRSNVRKSGKRSKFEETIGKQLDDAGMPYTYETYSYEYDVALAKNRARCLDCDGTNLVRTAWYTPDFFLDNGIIIEAKGRFTAANRRLILAVRQDHKELMDNLVMVFMRDNKIHRNSKTHYSDWCMENDVPFSIGEVKKEWLR